MRLTMYKSLSLKVNLYLHFHQYVLFKQNIIRSQLRLILLLLLLLYNIVKKQWKPLKQLSSKIY